MPAKWHMFRPDTDASDGVYRPHPGQVPPSAGDWRTSVVPRKRSEDMRRLAKANGWTDEQTAEKTADLIARKGGNDVYVPRTKAVTRPRVKGGTRPLSAQVDVADFMSGKVDGDYREIRDGRVPQSIGVRTRVRQAVAAGLIRPEDAPSWAREGAV